jgi:hypothetical protein
MKKLSEIEVKQIKAEAEKSGKPVINITEEGHFYLAHREEVEKVIKRKKGVQTNTKRGEKNYQAMVKISKDAKFDLATISKKNLISTFKPYFNQEGKKPGKYNLEPLGITQLYINQQRFKKGKS